jgi:hypothetical protein
VQLWIGDQTTSVAKATSSMPPQLLTLQNSQTVPTDGGMQISQQKRGREGQKKEREEGERKAER